jgi:hypothetical protein
MGQALHQLPGKDRTGFAVTARPRGAGPALLHTTQLEPDCGGPSAERRGSVPGAHYFSRRAAHSGGRYAQISGYGAARRLGLRNGSLERREHLAGEVPVPLARTRLPPRRPAHAHQTQARQAHTDPFRYDGTPAGGAFAARPGSQVDNLGVLLLDDVETRGATLDACAKALKQAGARPVAGMTIARPVRHPA